MWPSIESTGVETSTKMIKGVPQLTEFEKLTQKIKFRRETEILLLQQQYLFVDTGIKKWTTYLSQRLEFRLIDLRQSAALELSLDDHWKQDQRLRTFLFADYLYLLSTKDKVMKADIEWHKQLRHLFIDCEQEFLDQHLIITDEMLPLIGSDNSSDANQLRQLEVKEEQLFESYLQMNAYQYRQYVAFMCCLDIDQCLGDHQQYMKTIRSQMLNDSNAGQNASIHDNYVRKMKFLQLLNLQNEFKYRLRQDNQTFFSHFILATNRKLEMINETVNSGELKTRIQIVIKRRFELIKKFGEKNNMAKYWFRAINVPTFIESISNNHEHYLL